MKRDIDKRFLDAMREKLDRGRQKGLVGWDRHWEDTEFPRHPWGPFGFLAQRLRDEVAELTIALYEEDTDKILSEAADVANFAMMIADIHGALDPPEEA